MAFPWETSNMQYGRFYNGSEPGKGHDLHADCRIKVEELTRQLEQCRAELDALRMQTFRVSDPPPSDLARPMASEEQCEKAVLGGPRSETVLSNTLKTSKAVENKENVSPDHTSNTNYEVPFNQTEKSHSLRKDAFNKKRIIDKVEPYTAAEPQKYRMMEHRERSPLEVKPEMLDQVKSHPTVRRYKDDWKLSAFPNREPSICNRHRFPAVQNHETSSLKTSKDFINQQEGRKERGFRF